MLPFVTQTCSIIPHGTMSFQIPKSSSPPKRPRLSLQIKTSSSAITLGKSSTALKGDVDPTSPTAFNTLSNAYAAAIENASPRTPRPPSGSLDPHTRKPTSLRLETSNFTSTRDGYLHPSQRTQTPGPFSITYPDTPSSAFPSLQCLTPINSQPLSAKFAPPSTFTPPQSAGSQTEQPVPRVFTFAANQSLNPDSPRTPRQRRVTVGSHAAPYTHPRALHSILRNSPLPPRSSATPATPSRMSLRIARQQNKKVGYNDPLEQTITTNKYVKSHIDLLSEDSPHSATDADVQTIITLDQTMAYTGDETKDGGQTPGPFEEMRRRMADSGLETPATRKRKRKERKRKWEWTLGPERDEENAAMSGVRTPLTALQIQDTPITAIRRGVSVSTDDSEDEGRYQPSIPEEHEDEQRTRMEVVMEGIEGDDSVSVTDSSTESVPESVDSLQSTQSEPVRMSGEM